MGRDAQGFRSLSTVAVSAAASAAVVVQEGTKDLHAKVRKCKDTHALSDRLGGTCVSRPILGVDKSWASVWSCDTVWSGTQLGF